MGVGDLPCDEIGRAARQPGERGVSGDDLRMVEVLALGKQNYTAVFNKFLTTFPVRKLVGSLLFRSALLDIFVEFIVRQSFIKSIIVKIVGNFIVTDRFFIGF